MKLTQKQEGFVLSILEGKTQIDSYKANYNCENMKDDTIYSRASRLMKECKISARLDTLRNEKAKESKWTLDKLINEFNAVKEKCMQEEPVMKLNKTTGEYEKTGEYVFKEHGVIKSLENIGKLLGHYVEKTESKNLNINDDVTKLSKEERIKRIAELKKELGE